MLSYVARRVLLTVPVLFGITVFAFALLHVTGDPCTALLGERYSPSRCADIRRQYGLDQSPVVQYASYLRTTLSGDLGRSILTRRQVSGELALVFPATVELALAAMFIAVILGVPLGVLAAARHNSAADLLSMVLALLGVSMPVFWLGLMLVYVFAFKLGWFPTGGRIDASVDLRTVTHLYLVDSLLTGNLPAFVSALRHIALPALALSTIPTAIIARISRSSMLDVLHQDYVRTARAKGLGQRAVIARHALANALLPVVTVIGLQTGFLLSGAVLTETIFAWPGMGRWVVNAVGGNDTPVVQAGVLVFALVFVFANLAVDVSYAWLDPRIRY
jgi:peptide/nickel transport system permease protein